MILPMRCCALFVVFLIGIGLQASPAIAYEPGYEAVTERKTSEFSVGILPHHNPRTLFSTYNEIFNTTNSMLAGFKLKVVASRNYQVFDRRISKKDFDFLFLNSYELVKYAEPAGYKVFAKWDDDSQFIGMCMVHRDSHITNISDVRGKTIAFPAPSALAATMIPLGHLYNHGLQIGRDFEVRYVGSLESAVLSVYLGRVEIGCSSPRPWEKFARDNPEKAMHLRPLFRTRSLPRIAIAVRSDVPAEYVSQVQRALTSLHETEQGRKALAALPLARIVAANSNTFDEARDYIQWFTRTIYDLDQE